MQSILALLKSDDPSIQLDGLQQLNELLSVAMEDTLAMCPIDQVVSVLVSLNQRSLFLLNLKSQVRWLHKASH